MTKYYTVCYDLGGDIFKGYKTGIISEHLDKQVAEKVARDKYGWVEEQYDNLHPEFIAQMQRKDAELRG